MLNGWAGWTAATFATLLTLALVLGDLMDVGLRRWWATHSLTTDTVSGLLVLLITLLVVDQLVRRRQIRNRGRAVAAQAAIMVAQAARAGRAVTAVATGPAETEAGEVRDAQAQDAAADEVRTYMLMLLVGAPVLIEDPVARHFLEEAQHLGAIMVAALTALGRPAATGQPGAGHPAAGGQPAADSATADSGQRDSRQGDNTTPGSTAAGSTAQAAGQQAARQQASDSTRPGSMANGVQAARFDEAVARLRAASKPLLRYLKPEERAAANVEELLG